VQVSREPKSVSNETTFEEDTSDLVQLGEQIARLAQRVSERLQRRGLAGRTVVLKLTYRNFQHITRRTTLTAPTSDADAIAAAARGLLDRSAAASRLVRLVGVGVSGFTHGGGDAQLMLPGDPAAAESASGRDQSISAE
jgi:DNA polymerase-4